MSQQLRFLLGAVAAIVGIWVLAMAGHWYFESITMTADKVRAYVDSVNFGQLNGDARAQALKELEDKLNALSYDERQKLRMQHLIDGWFDQMTEAEKSQFLEATLPTGFKQMINAFQQLPDDKRRRLIDNTMRNLENGGGNTSGRRRTMGGTNAPPNSINGTNSAPISPELEAKIRSIGLNTFYSQSSAETKAELAPVLEELQHQMESGKVIMRQQPQ
ncbi:MAG TPA: hypothetical protein VMH87_04065 [Pseudomonadales bacterium]|nr:hypothetical protein [Pseudomonadales bacterium]